MSNIHCSTMVRPLLLLIDMAKSLPQKARILMVLPTLGLRTDLLRQTLESIKAQEPTKYDIAMIFPAKNKATADLAKEFGAMIADDPGSLSGAVNLGISMANSHHEYIGWIGDDDLISPRSLEVAINLLDKTPEAVVAFGYCDYIDDTGRKFLTSRAGKLAPWIMTWGPNLVPCPGTVFRLSALNSAGEFDINCKYSMDLDMFLRLRKLGKFISIKRVQASFRWHPTSITVANRSKILHETEQVKHKHLSQPLRIFAPIWDLPVRYATKLAARRVNDLASRK